MMPTIDEMIDSLPVKGVDEIEEPRKLSKTEIDAIRAKKGGKGRRSWSNPAEEMARRVLEGAFGCKNVKRTSDAVQGWQGGDKQWHYHYANRGKPDITFATNWQGQLWDGVAEVKSVAPSSTGLDVTLNNIKPWQIDSMEKATDKLRWWVLVFWEGVGKARVFVVDHDWFMRLIKLELPLRAQESTGNFMGKSLRRKADLDLIANCEVLKSNRWYLPDNHWFLQCE